jgi:TnsA endonuclease N terminal/Poxvirus D5 protein-like
MANMEHDSNVLEYYDQPSSFKIQYTNKAGRKIGHYHTPDFFVLSTESAAWVEWKTEAELEKLIVLDHLYVPLSEVPLVQHERVQLYPDRPTYDTYVKSSQHQTATSIAATAPPTLAANTRLRWDGRLWTLVNLGETTTTLLPEIGQPLQISSAFFYQLLNEGVIKLSEVKGATAASELLNTFIVEQFETPTQAPAASVYRAYQRACEQQGIPPLSRGTFYHRLQQRPIHEQTEKRKGSKAAYRHQLCLYYLRPKRTPSLSLRSVPNPVV